MILPATTVKMAINQGREIGATREQVRAHLELRSPQFPRPGEWSKATVESIPGFEAAAEVWGRFSASMVTAASASTEQHAISSPRREQAITRLGGLPHVAGRRTGAATAGLISSGRTTLRPRMDVEPRFKASRKGGMGA